MGKREGRNVLEKGGTQEGNERKGTIKQQKRNENKYCKGEKRQVNGRHERRKQNYGIAARNLGGKGTTKYIENKRVKQRMKKNIPR